MPPRGERDVLVAVDAIGVNFADTMVRRGEYRRDQSLDFTPGFEVAGRVVDGPPDGPEPGRLVVAFTEHGGGYADHVAVPLDHVLTVAEGVRAADAAALFTQGVTAWYAVHRYGRVAPGEAVVIHAAAGGLGSLCVQLSAEAGRASDRDRVDRGEARDRARARRGGRDALRRPTASPSACASSPADAAPT